MLDIEVFFCADFARHCERKRSNPVPLATLDCFVVKFIVGPATSGRPVGSSQ